MRRIILLLFLLTSPLAVLFCQDFDRSKQESITKLFVPPNGIYLYDSIFIDQTEIANIHWLEYLYYLKKDSSESFYISQLPDTSWQDKLHFKDTVAGKNFDYLRNPRYRYFPVVGIAYEQAVNYCKWRTDAVNIILRDGPLQKKSMVPVGFDVTVEFRLPSKEEWEFAACGGLDRKLYPYGLIRPLPGKDYTPKIKGQVAECLDRNGIQYSRQSVIHKMEFNVLEEYYFGVDDGVISCYANIVFDLASVFDYPQNGYAIHNMIGNVAEMVATKGLAKGGSYAHNLANAKIDSNTYYGQPEEWLGFRCVTIVNLKKKS